MMNSERFWHNGIVHISIAIGLVILWGTVCSPAKVYGQESKPEQKRVQSLTDRQVVEILSSRDREEAYKAAVEIVNRGERMIPLLASCKEDSRYFYGYGLGNHRSAFIIPLPSSDEEDNDGRYITIEVAALYLISAIYHQTLEFAQAPYLTDGTPVEQQRFNIRERIAEAWNATETWVQAVKDEGLKSLRKKRQFPLAESKVKFWGSR
jgi:hypothetical protein